MGRTKEQIGSLGQNPHANGERPNNPVGQESLDPRRKRVEWWKNAPEKIVRYPGGEFLNETGTPLYAYEGGSRLIMGEGEDAIQVMDSCQTPWAHATVDRAFEELGIKDGPINVLERGFGMGIIATRIIHHLALQSGTYTVIELNTQDADYARRTWRSDQLRALTPARDMPGKRPNHNVDINVIEGEAYEETARLAQEGKKFHIIISDTYPLTEDERGMNDLLDLETLKLCLEPKGVFAFFAHFPGSSEDIALNQERMITRHFESYSKSRVTITPPSDYKYLQPDTGPVRTLPVVICKNPIF